ncbi:MAG TPA: hypothetical protein P5543_01200 [Planctomycetota bacterium]|nr:hypothetical protein [Planctomycetota bacterium]HRU50793.1 hypothetical protein [Planctomycetota bacterium]
MHKCVKMCKVKIYSGEWKFAMGRQCCSGEVSYFKFSVNFMLK